MGRRRGDGWLGGLTARWMEEERRHFGRYGPWLRRLAILVVLWWLLMVFIDSTWTLFYITSIFGVALPLTVVGVHYGSKALLEEIRVRVAAGRRRKKKVHERKRSQEELLVVGDVGGERKRRGEEEEEERLPYDLLLTYLGVGAAAYVLRQILFRGFLMLEMAVVLMAVGILLLFTMTPMAVVLVAFAVGWCFMTYAWLASEFCRNMYQPRIFERTCDTIWYLHPILFVAVFAVIWWKKYSEKGSEYLVRSVFLFPILLSTLFFVIYWSLVSSNTTWTLPDDPYTKGSVLLHVPDEYALDTTIVYDYRDIKDLPDSAFPIFLKPNECSRSSRGTAPIEDHEQAEAYFRVRAEKKLERSTISQMYHEGGGEATIVYYRFPHWHHGQIKTVWDKVQLVPANHTGYLQEMRDLIDGERRERGLRGRTWKEHTYFARDPDVVPRPLRAIYDKEKWAQPQILGSWAYDSVLLREAVERIVDAMPGQFTAARFDVKFDSYPELAAGKFKVLEVDMPPFGDRREKFQKSSELEYSRFTQNLRRMRTFFMHFTIGFMNIGMGYSPGPMETARQLPKLIERSTMCGYNGSMSPITPGLQ